MTTTPPSDSILKRMCVGLRVPEIKSELRRRGLEIKTLVVVNREEDLRAYCRIPCLEVASIGLSSQPKTLRAFSIALHWRC